MGIFSQFLTELCARNTSIFSFPDDNLIKIQWIFTKLGFCIDIVKIWLWIANGQISSIFDSYLPGTRPDFHSHDNFSKCEWIFIKLAMCIDIVEICFGNVNGQILSIFDRVICPGYDSGGVLSVYVFV